MSLIVLIVILFTTYEIFKLNVLPNKYLILFIVGETILYLLGLLFTILKEGSNSYRNNLIYNKYNW